MAISSVTGAFNVAAKVTLQTADDGGGGDSHIYQFPPTTVQSGSLAYGTGAGKINKVHQKTYTIAAGGSTTLVLGDGSLLDRYGNANAFTKIREYGFAVMSGVDGDVLNIGNAAANAWQGMTSDKTKTVPLTYSGLIFVRSPAAAGIAVAAGTNEQVKIANPGGTPIDVNVYFSGE